MFINLSPHKCLGAGLLLFQALIANNLVSSDRILQLNFSMGFEGDIARSSVQGHNKTVVCVLGGWSHLRQAGGQFQLSNIDPTLCTQLIYRSAGIDNETYKIMKLDAEIAYNVGWHRYVSDLRKNYPHLKVLLAVGGWAEGSTKTFSTIAADYRKRQAFIQSAFGTMRQYGFHGLDFAWQYPTWRRKGGTPQDRENLPLLLQELRTALGEEYLLTITVPGDVSLAGGYNVRTISNTVDQLNVIAFDFAGSWSKKSHHHAPLKDSALKQSVHNAIRFYVDEGAPPEKLVLGIPFYGRTFLLSKDPPADGSQVNIVEASGLNQSIAGGYNGLWTNEPDSMGYHEICHNIMNNGSGWTTYKDTFCSVPFARKGQHWISFDNPESVQLKVLFGMLLNLKGFLGWTVDTDDFNGTACGGSSDWSDNASVITYPLLRTINYVITQETLKNSSANLDDTNIKSNDASQQLRNRSWAISLTLIVANILSHR